MLTQDWANATHLLRHVLDQGCTTFLNLINIPVSSRQNGDMMQIAY